MFTATRRPTPGITCGYQMLRPDGTHGSMTAACGPLVYRGDLFPADFYGDAFVAEPTGNLVKRIRLAERDGVVTGENAYEQTEFLPSTDERFRPVNLHNAPDGALYVVDMYRGIIQARGSITTYLRKQIDERKLVAPIGRGRIYRIVPDNAPAVVPLVKLDRAPTLELVRTLGHRNGWLRDAAQQRLVERRDPAAAEAVRDFYRQNSRPCGPSKASGPSTGRPSCARRATPTVTCGRPPSASPRNRSRRSLLNDEQIAGVMTFVRRNWSHEASPVAPATVRQVRAAIQGHDDIIDSEELELLAKEFPER